MRGNFKTRKLPDLQYIIKIYLFRNIFIVTLITVGNSSLNFFFGGGGEIHKINCGPTCFDNKQTFFLGQMFSSISNVCADGCYIVIVITNNFIGKILLFNIIAVYDIENGKLSYADTLGWPAPLKLMVFTACNIFKYMAGF